MGGPVEMADEAVQVPSEGQPSERNEQLPLWRAHFQGVAAVKVAPVEAVAAAEPGAEGRPLASG